MKKTTICLVTAFTLFLTIPPGTPAQHSHGQGTAGSGATKMDVREVLAEDVKVTFMVMANADHRQMLKDMKMKDDVEPGTTHNITVALKNQATLTEITDATVNMKVVDPQGQATLKPLKYESSMKSYDAYFSLTQKGTYQILILFRYGSQKKTAGIYYELR